MARMKQTARRHASYEPAQAAASAENRQWWAHHRCQSEIRKRNFPYTLDDVARVVGVPVAGLPMESLAFWAELMITEGRHRRWMATNYQKLVECAASMARTPSPIGSGPAAVAIAEEAEMAEARRKVQQIEARQIVPPLRLIMPNLS